jgi:hypothetical protein
VVHIDKGVAVNALEVRTAEAIFDGTQRLVRKQALSGCDNPDQLPLGLKGKDFIRIQKNVIIAATPYDFAAPDGVRRGAHGRYFCHLIGDLNRVA